MASSTSEERMGPAVPETEDSRQMCFSQVAHPAEPDPRMDETGSRFLVGKAFVYQPEDERGTIVTEWPNGVIDPCRGGGGRGVPVDLQRQTRPNAVRRPATPVDGWPTGSTTDC